MIAAVVAALALGAAPGSGPRPPLVAALQAEAARSLASLRAEGSPAPYYVSASVTARRATTLEAAGGALLPLREMRQRLLRVTVRVGGYDRDNSGFLDQMGGAGSGEVVASFPLDDDPLAMRRALWLAFDEAYKEAVATFLAKQSFLGAQGADPEESPGDFTREEARRGHETAPSLDADRARLEPLCRRLGAATAGASLPAARLRLSLVERTTTFVDSEGSEVTAGGTFAALEAAAWDQAPDGMPVRDLVMRYAPTLDGLGRPEDLEADLRAMIVSVQAQAAAPGLEEPYLGPVMFEQDAAADLFAVLLLPRVGQPRQPLVPGGGGGPAGDWGSRLGSRVLSASISVVDDPTLTSRGGVPLIGSYRYDAEGVLGRPVALITNGVLKDFVGTRWPRKNAPRSNGHARRAGGPTWNLGAVPVPSTLVVSAGQGAVDAAAARQRLLEELRTRELPFGLIVRRLDDSSILELGATDRLEAGDLLGRVHQDSELEMPVAIFRVTPDGREERIRGARFGRLAPEALRDLLAVTGPGAGEAVHNAVVTFDLGYSLTGPVTSSYLPFSVVAPGAIVLEEAELKPIPGPFARRPLRAARDRVKP